jgi:sensor histidine kinase YesM
MIKQIKRYLSRAVLHALFWILAILVFAFIFRLSGSISTLDIIYAIFFHVSVIAGVYANYYGIERWLRKGFYVRYSVFILTITVLVVLLNQYTFGVLVDLVLPGYYFVSQFNLAETGIIFIIYLIITSATKLLQAWFELQKLNQRMVKEEKEKLDSELRSLKAQINPHFLFNSLNVVYSLALKNDETTAEVILKLSDILRYVIYDSARDQVSISSEVLLLNKYIELQKYRVEDSTPITFTSEIEKDVMIAPLILLTLIENSFKHGIKSDTENVFINIRLHSGTDSVYFEIENNKANNHSNNPDGVGLENIRKRLMIQYPGRHTLDVYDNNDTFKVCLKIGHEES